MIQRITTDVLDIAFEAHGDPAGWPVVLLHGFPYDVRSYDDVAPILADAGARVIAPWLRGYGATAYRSPDTMRSGQQGALADDLRALLDAAGIAKALVAGYDWGGRAACIVAALWPERVSGLVTCGGYNLQDIAKAVEPVEPDAEHRLWYQYYLHGERGRAGLDRNRHAFCKLLWKLWSPTWRFDDATFERSFASFGNSDFVDTVVHSYRHRFGLVDGDPAYAAIEAALAKQPAIAVPTIALFGNADGVASPSAAGRMRAHFTGSYDARFIDDVGHDVPQEAPRVFAQAVLDVKRIADAG